MTDRIDADYLILMISFMTKLSKPEVVEEADAYSISHPCSFNDVLRSWSNRCYAGNMTAPSLWKD